MTQSDLARKVGVSQTHISNIERGKTYDFKLIKQIAPILDLNHRELLLVDIGVSTTVETEIGNDPSLQIGDRDLLLRIYGWMRERGPMVG